MNKETPKPQAPATPTEERPKVEPEKLLFSWKAPARPFKRRNKDFYVTMVGIAAIVGIIVFLLDGWLPVLLIIALVFLFYVMSTVEPETIEYKITTWGIYVADKITPWGMLGQYWFSRRFDSELLVISAAIVTGRLEMVIGSKEKDKVKQAIGDRLLLEEVPPAFLDRAANWFSKKLPQG